MILRDVILSTVPTGELVWASSAARNPRDGSSRGNYTSWSGANPGSIVPDVELFPAVVLRRVHAVEDSAVIDGDAERASPKVEVLGPCGTHLLHPGACVSRLDVQSDFTAVYNSEDRSRSGGSKRTKKNRNGGRRGKKQEQEEQI